MCRQPQVLLHFPELPEGSKFLGETHFGAALLVALTHSAMCCAAMASPRAILGILRWRQRQQQLHPPSSSVMQNLQSLCLKHKVKAACRESSPTLTASDGIAASRHFKGSIMQGVPCWTATTTTQGITHRPALKQPVPMSAAGQPSVSSYPSCTQPLTSSSGCHLGSSGSLTSTVTVMNHSKSFDDSYKRQLLLAPRLSLGTDEYAVQQRREHEQLAAVLSTYGTGKNNPHISVTSVGGNEIKLVLSDQAMDESI